MLLAALALCITYTVRYLGYPARPGEASAGWWAWFDQGKYLQSAQAFASGNFAPDNHFYAPGYALLGALFVKISPLHPFFVVNLACLLASFAGFIVVSGRIGVPAWLGAGIFLAVTQGDKFFAVQWVIPWNTSLSGALLWLVMALEGWPFCTGLLAGAVVLVRPADVLLAGPCLLAKKDWHLAAAGFLLPVVVAVGLYLRIYGPHPSAYALIERQRGFSLHDFGWKAYVVFINPVPWFWDGEGLLRHAPWLALGIAGLAPALARGGLTALLAAVVVLHAGLYLAYVDMLPTGIWRYDNVHYFTWIFPAYGLLAWLLLKDLAARKPVAWASLAVTALILCIHVNPVPARGAGAKMLDFPGATAPFATAYFGDLRLRDDAGVLVNVNDMHVIPIPGGLRVVALRRGVIGNAVWVHGYAPEAGTALTQRWAMQVKPGWPCWLAIFHCETPAKDPALPDYGD
jgi:hypothetical protein